jgi:hypothetical protein
MHKEVLLTLPSSILDLQKQGDKGVVSLPDAPPSQLVFYRNIHSPEFIEHNTISKSIDDFLETLGNGDIVFSRSESFVGKVIQNSVKSIWNHVGMCIVCKETGVKCYWESSASKDSNTLPESCRPMYGGGVQGVRMWPLRNRLKEMLKPKGSSILFAVAKLTLQKPIDMTLYYKRLDSFTKKASGLPYQNNYLVLFFAWFDGMTTLKRYLCSSWSEDEHDHDMLDDRGSLVNNEWMSEREIVTLGGTGRANASITKDMGADVDNSYTLQKTYFCSQLIVDTLVKMGIMNHRECPGCSEWTVDDLFYVRNINKYLKDGILYKHPITFLVGNKVTVKHH